MRRRRRPRVGRQQRGAAGRLGRLPRDGPDNSTGTYERCGPRTILPLNGVVFAIGPQVPEIENAYIAQRKPDGSVEAKFPWWRAPGVNGHHRTINGHSLSGPPRAVRSSIPRVRRTDFQPSTIIFPSESSGRYAAKPQLPA